MPYGQDEQVTRSLRIVTDHTRAVTFMIGDGVLLQRGAGVRRPPAAPPGGALRAPAGAPGALHGPLAGAVIERFGSSTRTWSTAGR